MGQFGAPETAVNKRRAPATVFCVNGQGRQRVDVDLKSNFARLAGSVWCRMLARSTTCSYADIQIQLWFSGDPSALGFCHLLSQHMHLAAGYG